MARDNRKANREAAKAAGNENKKPGDEFAELTDDFTDPDVDEEVIDDGSNNDDGNTNKNNNDDDIDEDASKREAEALAATAATTDVDKKKAEEEARVAEEARLAEEAKKAETPEAKAAREAEEAKAAEPAKKVEPTAEEKAAKEAKDKADKDAADAAAAKAAENPQLTDEEAAKLFGDWRGTTEKLLAEHVYKLTEEDVAQLNENPAAYIPKAMARVYLDTISASFQQFVNYLPRMVHQVLEARDIHAKSETDFFSAWPDLPKDEATKKAILRIGGAYRQANPTATAEEWINEVGAQAMVALRIQPKQPVVAAIDPVTQQPFKPASGTPAFTPPQRTPANPFDAMAQEFGSVEEIDDN